MHPARAACGQTLTAISSAKNAATLELTSRSGPKTLIPPHDIDRMTSRNAPNGHDGQSINDT